MQSGADLKLVNAGIRLAREKGLTGFTVRQLCGKAKVNPGLFHYYFASRENFNRSVLKELYSSEILKQLEINDLQNLKPKEKLVAVQELLGNFTKKNSSILASFVTDILSGDGQILSFIAENFTLHIKTIAGVIKECKNEGFLEDTDTLTLMISFILPVVGPNLAAGILKKILDKKKFTIAEELSEKFLSDKHIKERSRLALKAILK